MPDIQVQPRVLVVRLGAMGDILHALPAVSAIRAAHLDWYLGWAIEPRWRALLCADSQLEDRGRGPAMPLVDCLHRVNAKRWARNLYRPATVCEVMVARSELRAEDYDVAIDLQGSVRSAVVGLWSHADRRIGEAVPREYPARFFFNRRIATRSTHVIDQACEVASAISNENLVAAPVCLPHDQDAEAWCELFLNSNVSGRFVLMNPGAGWGAKRWPVERFGQVAAALHELGYTVLANTGPDETTLAEALIKASGRTTVKLECTLGQLIAITRRASLMIAGDTGPLHLASALRRPVVGIFGPTDPARNGPVGSNYRVLRSPESKRDHTRRAEPEAGILQIMTRNVLDAALELLRGSEVE